MNPIKKHWGEKVTESWQQTRYVVRNSSTAPDKLLICPPHSDLNMAPNQQHRGDYGTGLFEGSSAEPTVDAQGNIKEINVVLLEPRLKRFQRSLQTRGLKLDAPVEHFAQALLDIVAIHGAPIVTTDDGKPTRAYLRPAAGPGVGTWGISLKPGYFIEASHTVFRWGPYFPDTERVYQKEGVKAVITGVRRDFEITGKHASNYGAAALDGSLARTMNYDELIYLAPYGMRGQERDYSIRDFDQQKQHGVIADGPGEEIFGITPDGSTMVYPPMRVNRLGGTVLQYLIDHMAPALGIQTREQDITVEDLRSGKIVGLGFAGNAARVTPIGQIDLVRPESSQSGTVEETVFHGGIHPTVARLSQQWENEMRGLEKPSHESLLTPVDLEWGEEYRAELDAFWSNLGF